MRFCENWTLWATVSGQTYFCYSGRILLIKAMRILLIKAILLSLWKLLLHCDICIIFWKFDIFYHINLYHILKSLKFVIIFQFIIFFQSVKLLSYFYIIYKYDKNRFLSYFYVFIIFSKYDKKNNLWVGGAAEHGALKVVFH